MSAEKPLPVSVCVLVKDEADRLPRTLPPLKAFSEVLVYDSGSSDNSVSLCREAGVTVIEGEWLGFSQTRKKLFALANQPWILWLDADEVVTGKLLAELHGLFASEPDRAAYEINRMVCFENKWIRHGDWFPDWNVRLFRADSWSMENRAVHESISVSGEIGRLSGLLEHYTYRDWQDQRTRSAKYAALWAEQHAGRKVAPLEPQARALWRFFKGYILKLGFLDGVLGFKVALANAREVALKYKLLSRLNTQRDKAAS